MSLDFIALYLHTGKDANGKDGSKGPHRGPTIDIGPLGREQIRYQRSQI